jgi:hypothetical protein
LIFLLSLGSTIAGKIPDWIREMERDEAARASHKRSDLKWENEDRDLRELLGPGFDEPAQTDPREDRELEREFGYGMPPQEIVSAAVTPAIMEEIDRLATSSKRSRSEVVRTLLEEQLTQRANERMEGAYAQVEKRLAKMDQRFSGLLVKAIRLIAQDLSTFVLIHTTGETGAAEVR